jgi:hypothetical protein
MKKENFHNNEIMAQRCVKPIDQNSDNIHKKIRDAILQRNEKTRDSMH